MITFTRFTLSGRRVIWIEFDLILEKTTYEYLSKKKELLWPKPSLNLN